MFGRSESDTTDDASSKLSELTVPVLRNQVPKVVNNTSWLHSDFISTVQQRGAAVINARKLSSAMSAAKAISDHMHDFLCGSAGKKRVQVHRDASAR